VGWHGILKLAKGNWSLYYCKLLPCDENELPFDLYETIYIGCIQTERHYVRHFHYTSDIFSKVFFFYSVSRSFEGIWIQSEVSRKFLMKNLRQKSKMTFEK
jgi:hypothetical protein